MPLFGDRRLERRSGPRLTGESGKNNDLAAPGHKRGAKAPSETQSRLLGGGSGACSPLADQHEGLPEPPPDEWLFYVAQLLSAQYWAPYQADADRGPGFVSPAHESEGQP